MLCCLRFQCADVFAIGGEIGECGQVIKTPLPKSVTGFAFIFSDVLPRISDGGDAKRGFGRRGASFCEAVLFSLPQAYALSVWSVLSAFLPSVLPQAGSVWATILS